MYSKADIFNLALGALLLQRKVTDPDTDKSNENNVLLTHYETALYSALADMDLDSTSTTDTLELVETDPNSMWSYSYKYPTNCVKLRRVIPPSTLVECRRDNSWTQVRRRVEIRGGQKVILTDQQEADIEFIPKDVPLSSLTANGGLAVAYKLASLAAPLIVGKGAGKLREDILKMYSFYVTEAKQNDKEENAELTHEWEESDMVMTRLS